MVRFLKALFSFRPTAGLLAIFGVAVVSVITVQAAEVEAATTVNQQALEYTLVVTGEELLRGAFADSHTAFITRTLHLLGGRCVGSMIVDDNGGDLREALRFATNKAKLVIVTGGLGPTANDGTREVLAEFTGIPLREHPDVLDDMERRMQQPRDKLRPTMRRQTLVPTRGTYLKNPGGTAVGLVFEGDEQVIVALPGPPRELQPMVSNELVPYLRRKFGMRAPGVALTLRFVGIGQSKIDQTIREHATVPADLVTGSVFEAGRVDFMFALPGDAARGKSRLQNIETALRAQLGDYIYADDGTSLEAVVTRQLQERVKDMVVVEVGSGGHLAASFHGVPGARQLLRAAHVAPTEERLRHLLEIPDADWNGASGRERVRALAQGAQQRSSAGFSVAIGETDRRPDGTLSVWVAYGSGSDILVQQLPLQGSGELANANLVTQILDCLRRSRP